MTRADLHGDLDLFRAAGEAAAAAAQRALIAEARGSKYPDSTCGCNSTTETATPALAMFSAACMPIRPAPSTIAERACPIACRKSTASSIDRST